MRRSHEHRARSVPGVKVAGQRAADYSAAVRRSTQARRLLHIAAGLKCADVFDATLTFPAEMYRAAVERYAVAMNMRFADAEATVLGKAVALIHAGRVQEGVRTVLVGEMRRAREALDAGLPLPADLFG